MTCCRVFMTMLAAGCWLAYGAGEAFEKGLALYRQGEFAQARTVLLSALENPQNAAAGRAAVLHVLGLSEESLRLYGDARLHLEEALRTWPEDAASQEERTITLESLAYVLCEAGDFAAGERVFLEAIAAKAKLYGPQSAEAAAAKSNLAEVYTHRGQLAKAKVQLQEAFVTEQATLPAGHFRRLTTQIRLSSVLVQSGEAGEAVRVAGEAEAAGRDSALYPEILSALGDAYRQRGEMARAVPLLKRSSALAEKAGRVLPPAELALAYIDAQEGRLLLAEQRFQRVMATMERLSGPGTVEVALAQIGLAGVEVRQGRAREASGLVEAGFLRVEQSLPPDHPFRAASLVIRAAVAAAGEGPVPVGEAVHAAVEAINRLAPQQRASEWQAYVMLMKAHRPDLAKAGEKQLRNINRRRNALVAAEAVMGR